MAFAFVQDVENSASGANATLDTSATPITVVAGDTLVCCTSHGSTATPVAPTSNLGSVFNFLFDATQSGQHLHFWLCQNALGGSDFFTGKADSPGTNLQGVLVVEYSGLLTSGGALAFAGLGQNGPGAGANTVTSGPVSVNILPCALIGISNNRSANGFPLVGTSPIAFTDRGNFWPNIAGGARGRLEDTRLTLPGNYAATFDCNTHTGSLFISGVIALAEIGSVPVNQLSYLTPFNLGPEPQAPFNLNQFHPFKFQANYNPVPLFLNADFGSFVFTGENATLSAISQAVLLANPGLFTLNGLPVTFLLGPAAGVLFGTTGRPGGRITLNSKRQGEIIGYQVDFANSLAAGELITTASVTSTVYSGIDPTPQGIVLGNATFQGTLVDQGIGGGAIGTIYSTIWKVTTTLGQIIEINALIAILADSP